MERFIIVFVALHIVVNVVMVNALPSPANATPELKTISWKTPAVKDEKGQSTKNLFVPDDEVLILTPMDELGSKYSESAYKQTNRENDSLENSSDAVTNSPEENDDESLVTADSVVFLPLFSYKKTTAQRRRIYSYNNYKPVRRYSYPVYYYTRYPSTYYSRYPSYSRYPLYPTYPSYFSRYPSYSG